MEKGKLKQNGVHLQDHEYDTVRLFLEIGYDVTLIPPIQTKGINSPDMEMMGIIWEIKAPLGKSRNTIKRKLASLPENFLTVIKQNRKNFYKLNAIIFKNL